ncbi:uncharacterized protein LOC120414127 isoform X2 [Culex pipiens pallens]|uniref:uncharacterized protein LOC120414127 isoform X2 n=1 Tax=Culex pipiens pallens TaxID=42434 RepID=UPI00195313D3|nr:uncharacterized protein LOC120414127 isoform X2 [Culex pipiens pallens]
MYCSKMEFRTIWILVLLVYTKVSGGEFYDPTNGSNLGGAGSVQGSLHSLPEPEGSGEGAPVDTIVPPKGFVRPEINFIAKLRQRQRQRALVPAVAITVGQHQPVEAVDPDSDYPDVDLATLGEDLAMVVRFLDQHWVELFGGGGGEKTDDQPQQMQPGQKRAAALRTSMSRRSNSFNMPKERFSPSISVGALTNLGDFFQNLKHNLETLETRDLSNEQVKLLEGQNMITNLRKGRIHRRLSQTCRKCGIPTRYSELSPFEPNTSAGVVRSGFVPRDQLPRSGVQTCGTRKVSFPMVYRPHPLLSC